METHSIPPAWQVLLIGGASGVGKTRVSYRLAQHYGIGITEVDDFQVILERMTTPEQQPILHFWRTNPEAARRMDEQQQLQFFISYARVIAVALELVIANHIESRAPVVLEGDFILPELALLPAYEGIPAAGQVRALIIYEQDEAQIASNYFAREGEEQPQRAWASWRNSEWLRQEAARLGVPAIPARPWETVFERAIEELYT
jgi:2-phosphoglycerate kinase